MVYPNWKSICLIPDQFFKMAVSLAFTRKQPYVLNGLRAGFPELFSEEQTPLKIPASALKAAARERSRKEGHEALYGEFDTELWLPVEEFHLPDVYLAEQEVPENVWGQLIGQKFEFGLSVEYQGLRYLVSSIDDEVAELHGIVEENPILEKTHLGLIPLELVDTNA